MKQSFFFLIFVGHFCPFTCQLYDYHFVNESMKWTEAQQFCRKHFTDLATVTNRTDLETLKTLKGNSRGAWIGLHYEAGVSETFHWSQPGLEFNKTDANWNVGEPNGGKDETCVALCEGCKWVDVDCTGKKYFLCYNERDHGEVLILGSEKNWFEAQEYCRTNHTDLVSAPQLREIEKENGKSICLKNNVLEFIKSSGLVQSSILKDCNGGYIFIGLFRATWSWSDGSSFYFRLWDEEYSNRDKRHHNCSKLTRNGRWSVDDCGEERPFFCYQDHVILINESRTWEEALYYCRHHHHDLVTITNLDDQRWVQEKTKNATTPYVWTGLRYTCTLGFWFWVSDEVVRYKNWASPEQVNECDMSGAMETGGEHKWVKINDEEKFNFFCSK
ncbi:C-type mannose receptor 2-like isoform X1 [Oryzias melastigma]|uniref:C-type mannose receptor 2-like isoform X1 n=1 Tax=Oryzias melastigma TaxID=30732 RepID=UPI00168CBB10|nr:C-type mannose receptor 2-like isoform X1 [Oryzias melastigma]